MSPIIYPYDPTGISPVNFIPDEQHTVTEANYRDYYFIVPEFAPIFITNFKARWVHNGDVAELKEGLDYAFAIPSVNGINSKGKLVYGAITIINPDIKEGIIALDYQTIGGDTIGDRDYVLTRIAERVYNPRLTTWESVTDKYTIYPPMEHPQDFDTFVGQKELIDAILGLATKIHENSSQLGIVRHLLKTDNPHNTTKDQVGLGDVENLPVASLEEVVSLEPIRKYITQDTLLQVITQFKSDNDGANETLKYLNQAFNNHINNENAHGLAVIKNYLQKTSDEILEINSEINTLKTTLNKHIIDKENPHSVSKNQIELNNVQNYETATIEEVLNKDEIDKYITLKHLVKYVNEFGGMGNGGSQYNLTATSSVIPEGESAFFTLNAPEELEGQILYWTITHLTTKPSDFVEENGETRVIGGTAIFEVKTLVDIDTEDDEFFAVRIRKDSIEGDVIAVSSTIKLTNVPSNATYRIMSDRDRYDENTTMRFNIDTTNLPNGIVLYWNIKHGDTSPSDFKQNNGVVQIFNNHAQAMVDILKTNKDHEQKLFNIELRYGSVSGRVITTSNNLYINSKIGIFTLSTICCPQNLQIELNATSYWTMMGFINSREPKRNKKERWVLSSKGS